MRRIVSLWLPRWLIEQEPQGQGPLDQDTPLVMTWAQAQQQRVLAANTAATRAGIRSGMPLANALSLCPGLLTKPYEAQTYQAALRHLQQWAGLYSPFTSLQPFYTSPESWNGDAGLYLDVTGAAAYFKGETTLLQRMQQDLAARGLTARLALTTNAAAAWGLSRYAASAKSSICLVPEDQPLLPQIRNLPTAALRLPSKTIMGLDNLGLRKLHHLTQQARASLQTRFGALLTQRLGQMLGEVAEPLCPRPEPDRFSARLCVTEPLISSEGIETAFRTLLEKVALQLSVKRRGARDLQLTLYRVDGQRNCLTIKSARPMLEVAAWQRLTAPLLEKLDLGFGIEGLMLKASIHAPIQSTQEDWLSPQQAHKQSSAKSATVLALDRIAQRLGAQQVERWRPALSHRPEATVQASPWGKPLPKLSPEALQRIRKKLRPTSLFARPEPAQLSDKTLTWRKRSWPLSQLEGPERITMEWWEDTVAEPQAQARDYYRCLTQDGDRLWLYCEASNRQAPQSVLTNLPVFVHGVF